MQATSDKIKDPVLPCPTSIQAQSTVYSLSVYMGKKHTIQVVLVLCLEQIRSDFAHANTQSLEIYLYCSSRYC